MTYSGGALVALYKSEKHGHCFVTGWTEENHKRTHNGGFHDLELVADN
jgi:hypothetical protein